MLTLSGRVIKVSANPPARQLLSITVDASLHPAYRKSKALLIREDLTSLPDGFAHYISFEGSTNALSKLAHRHTIVGNEFAYLGEGDVIAISGEGRLRSIFRANSDHNSILLTEQCNNYCLMCSQPPKSVDDRWLLDEAFDAIRLIPRSTPSLGITGGEPTLFGDGFLDLLRHIKNWLPQTGLHVLSNGRAFADETFVRKYAQVEHPDLMVGIPVYSSDPARHDYVVQAVGAFDETIRGVLNLKRLGQKVEIRVVLHRQTCEGLPALAEFIARNLLFVDHVALMGLEMTGFTRANLDALWIDPIEYQKQLSAATRILATHGIKTSIYNHPLCLVEAEVEPYYVKSISDWKNEFPSECAPCFRKERCGGFFSSGLRHGYSKSIRPFAN